ncbi:hypothetical protein [Teichococcus aestuarii]|uniref:hypothetical protein n=1 Tax=Teichococcus aestuarii TaxID=568898 RepID=UPI0036093356
MTLILGRDEAALDLAERLKDRLDITVLLTGEADVAPRPQAEYPVLRGRARSATGWLGHFAVAIDGYAAAAPPPAPPIAGARRATAPPANATS